MGELFIVSTPIGNLEDISLRAIRILKEVDLIACEDTRKSKILLGRYDIHTPLTSFHEYNKVSKSGNLIKLLKGNKRIALVSEAGTPGISDPGFYLIRLAIRENIKVIPIPGPSALLAGLVVSGLPTDSFIFYGFLPRKGSKRKKWFEKLGQEEKTVVFYESPYRLLATLEELMPVTETRMIAVGRELTKKYEEVRRGTAEELEAYFKLHSPRGEFVLIVAGRDYSYKFSQPLGVP
ncbi:MAG: 16S rRNA (cytidine(1402)-2'-O)-methyltransferase [Candidatus Ratteibacteria bacterium]|nr:16S rRNA (cytidine(1402)-2'-O)-methyltransferase [Candidatus Ratteibacteria bacterium]